MSSASVAISEPCEHLDAAPIRKVKRPAPGCVECLKSGGQWLHLRECLTCGHVGCCDDSPSRHATAHFHATKHPIITSVEVGEDWAWCFVDERVL